MKNSSLQRPRRKHCEWMTEDLTITERTGITDVVVNILKTCQGRHKAVTPYMLARRVKDAGYTITPRRVRKVVNLIRLLNLVPNVIETALGGYHCAQNIGEFHRYAMQIQAEAQAQHAVKMALINGTTIRGEQLQCL